MMFRNTLCIVLTVLYGSLAHAGAWGSGAFDNDDALDWVYELEQSSGTSALAAAIRPVATAKGYIDAPDASYAIAAAETLAAMIGEASDGLPEEILVWVRKQNQEPSRELLADARDALNAILDEDRSELAQLWSENSKFYSEWQAELRSLSERLK